MSLKKIKNDITLKVMYECMCEQIFSVMRPESLKDSDTSSDNLQGLLMFQEINVRIFFFLTISFS